MAENAPPSVTNTATVSGGGDENTSNDTATDTSNVGVVLPAVTGTTPSLSGGTVTAGLTTISVNFSEAMTASGAAGAGNAENYTLETVGPDGLFSDPVSMSLSVSYSGTTATLTFAGLAENVYRLTVDGTIANTAGTAIGGNWVSDFVVVPGGTLLGSAASTALSGTDPLSVATGDFNHNGKRDLVVADAGTGTVEVLLNNGNGTFSDTSYAITYSGHYGYAIPYSVCVGDFNGDGNLDFAVANYDQVNYGLGSGTIEVFKGNGDGTFTFASEYQGSGSGTSFDPIAIVAADFNGDGKVNLAVANYYQGVVNVLAGNGDGTFSTTPATYAVGTDLAPWWSPTSTPTAIPIWPWRITAATTSPCS